MISTLSLMLILVIFILLLVAWVIYRLGFRQGAYKTDLNWQEKIPALRKDIAGNQRANIKGKVAETFAPFLEGFPFKPSECKFIGDPVDYLVFEGLNERDVRSIHFLEVKSDSSNLNKQQKQIKDLVDSLDSGKLTFKEFDFKTKEILEDKSKKL